jgi:hypothetical protein
MSLVTDRYPACFKVAEETGRARQEALYLSLPLQSRRVVWGAEKT